MGRLQTAAVGLARPMSVETAGPHSSPAISRLRGWQWAVFLLPGVVCAATTWILVEMNLARDRASGYTFLSDYSRTHMALYTGMGGLMAGGIASVVAGLVLGLSTRARHRVLAVIGWMFLSAFAGLGIAGVGCGAVESRIKAHGRPAG
jgi:hypothetical protein